MRLIKLTIAVCCLVMVGAFGTATIFAVPPCDCKTTAGRKGVWNADRTDCRIIECAEDLDLELPVVPEK